MPRPCSTGLPTLQDPSLRYAFRVVSPEKEYHLQVGGPGWVQFLHDYHEPSLQP